ncbi:MAG TPA: nuclear transport factor 2 family protein [Candidatus Binatia bacterium]|nr:nuclear transport factor 2 family protein [Candidatus Binatia bacterium]
MAHARLVQDWVEGWNGRDLDRVMSHYAEDAIFQSPTVLLFAPQAGGTIRGRDAIRRLYETGLARHPRLRFELEDVIERPGGVLVVYRKLNVFSDAPGLTVETFETEGGLVRRNVVYWGMEEVASRFARA